MPETRYWAIKLLLSTLFSSEFLLLIVLRSLMWKKNEKKEMGFWLQTGFWPRTIPKVIYVLNKWSSQEKKKSIYRNILLDNLHEKTENMINMK